MESLVAWIVDWAHRRRPIVLAIVIAAVALRMDAFAVIGSVAIVTVVLGALYRRWLGGVTGDTLGAASELAELTGLLVAAAVG